MTRRAFADFDPGHFPGLEWIDALTLDEAADLQTRRESCPHLATPVRCCAPAVCRNRGVVSLTDCFGCLEEKRSEIAESRDFVGFSSNLSGSGSNVRTS